MRWVMKVGCCSAPGRRAGKLSLPFVYSNEVWTGIEYQVASHSSSKGRLPRVSTSFELAAKDMMAASAIRLMNMNAVTGMRGRCPAMR
jgi:uncharacterized protein (DUF608 family)